MKYLKTFESKTVEEDIRKFCEDNLAYLLDGGFHIEVDNHIEVDKYKGDYDIYLVKNSYGNYSRFSWYDVRDDVIPFMSILSKQYIVSGIRFKHKVTTDEGSYIANKDIRVSDIVDDKIEDIEIIGIVFNVTNK